MAKNVRFYSGTREQYDKLVNKNPLALYFCDDTGELFKGDVCISDAIRIVPTRSDLPECTCAADGVVYFIAETKSGFMVSPDRTEWLQTIYAPVTDAYSIPEEEMYTTVTTVGAVRDIEEKIYKRIEEVAAGGISNLTAGDGVEIVDNKISVKLADTTHGLAAVDGAIALNLVTKDHDGAMSKEDKKTLDAIPSVYVARKYDIAGTPKGTLVDYRDEEIRVMVPSDAEFIKQDVGAGGDKNTFYMTFKTYCPSDDAVGYVEHLGDQTDTEILTDLKTDEYGRRYQPTWLGVAKYNETTGAWTYYGANSNVGKYIGWDYRIDWYDANGVMVASDCIRINLSNEDCHNNAKPYYVANYATVEEVTSIKESLADAESSYTWNEM